MQECPFCRLLRGEETERNRLSDVVWQGNGTTALVSPKWWEAAPGHVLVVPDEHVENLYEIAPATLGAVYETVRRVARALRAAGDCDGTSTRQHNEAGGGQDVWHFHVHVFPRRAGDALYERNAETRWASPGERAAVAARLRTALPSD